MNIPAYCFSYLIFLDKIDYRDEGDLQPNKKPKNFLLYRRKV
jgi:hypothetical protein